MMVDHETRLRITREHHDLLRQSMLAARRRRHSSEGDVPGRQDAARIYTFPKVRTQTQRGAAA